MKKWLIVFVLLVIFTASLGAQVQITLPAQIQGRVETVYLTPDGKNYFCLARGSLTPGKTDHWDPLFLFSNGVLEGPIDFYTPFQMPKDGKSWYFTYQVRDKGSYIVSSKGKIGPIYGSIQKVMISPKDGQVYYVLDGNQKMIVGVNLEPRYYQDADIWGFQKDDGSLIYKFRLAEKDYVRVGEKEYGPFEEGSLAYYFTFDGTLEFSGKKGDGIYQYSGASVFGPYSDTYSWELYLSYMLGNGLYLNIHDYLGIPITGPTSSINSPNIFPSMQDSILSNNPMSLDLWGINVVMILKKMDQQYLRIGKTVYGPYSKISGLTFVESTKSVIFMTEDGGKTTIHKNGQKAGPFDGQVRALYWADGISDPTYVLDNKVGQTVYSKDLKLGPFEFTSFLMSPDGLSLAHQAQTKGKVTVNYKNEKWGPFDKTVNWAFSPSGQLLLLFKEKEKLFYQYQGKKLPLPGDLQSVWFSDDGKNLFFMISQGNSYQVIGGAVTLGPFDSINILKRASNGEPVNYVISKNGTHTLVRGNLKTEIPSSNFLLSPDVSTFANWTKDFDGQGYVLWNGKKFGPYISDAGSMGQGLSNLTFSRDSKALSWTVESPGGKSVNYVALDGQAFRGTQNGEHVIWADGEKLMIR